MKPLMKTMAAVLAAAVLVPAVAHAGSVENMERERAMLLDTLLQSNLTATDRQAKTATAERRLADLESIVLRDKSLVGRDTSAVKRAFANYDLTFLVHASAENRITVLDQWLGQVGMSTQDILSATRQRR